MNNIKLVPKFQDGDEIYSAKQKEDLEALADKYAVTDKAVKLTPFQRAQASKMKGKQREQYVKDMDYRNRTGKSRFLYQRTIPDRTGKDLMPPSYLDLFRHKDDEDNAFMQRAYRPKELEELRMRVYAHRRPLGYNIFSFHRAMGNMDTTLLSFDKLYPRHLSRTEEEQNLRDEFFAKYLHIPENKQRRRNYPGGRQNILIPTTERPSMGSNSYPIYI